MKDITNTHLLQLTERKHNNVLLQEKHTENIVTLWDQHKAMPHWQPVNQPVSS